MPTFAGGNIAMGNAQKANVAVSLLIQPLHKDMNRALVVVTDGGKTLRISCQQHQRGFPGAINSSVMPVKPNSTTPSMLRRLSMPRCSITSVGEN